MAVKNCTYNIQEVGLAKALVRLGNTCDIVFWTDKNEETVILPVEGHGKIRVFYRRGKTVLKNTIYSGCNDLFSQYDIIQPCEYNQIQAWHLARKLPNKTIIYHGPYYSEFNKRYNLMCKVFDAIFLRGYIKRGTKFLTKSEMAKEFLVCKGIKSENVKTIGVGIDTQMLVTRNGICNEYIYLQMKNDTSKLKILYVGRFEERRNIPFIFEIFAKVYEQYKEAKLYIVGTGEADYVMNAFEYAAQLGIREQIVWQERMEQKYLSNIYRLADFFLLPTKYEIFGMVLLEAMYYKTVVLTTRNGGSSTLIKNEENGFIFYEEDAEKWASCIININKNKHRMHDIEVEASRKVEKEFTWDSLAVDFIKQYQRWMQ